MMKSAHSIYSALIGCIAFAASANAEQRYVNVNSTSATPPYTNWATAANIIQDAIDLAVAGDEIVVTNGVYQTGGRLVYGALTSRVAVTTPITLRSVNGPEFTVIRGYQLLGTTNGNGAVRCVYLTSGALLAGFTVTQGATRTNGDYDLEQSGGGVFCKDTDALVTNCVFSGNAAQRGGGAAGGTVNNSSFTGNSAIEQYGRGGGAYYCVANNCRFTNNAAAYEGGGAFNSTLNYCTLASNSALGSGGGAAGGSLINCTLSGNSAGLGGGASGRLGVGGRQQITLNNCTLTGNSADSGGGAYSGTLNNCTLTGNSAAYGGGANSCVLNNCIAYFNMATHGVNHYQDYSGGAHSLNYCCTMPQPTDGVGNITNAPLFVDPATGNLRLQSNSPCINAGRNAYAPTGPDLDDNPRITGGTVDIGAYEFQSPQSSLSYAWLQQYGFPTDGSADLADSDGDGHNNWQEWRAWTDPISSASVLRLLAPSVGTNGLLVRWQSVSGQTYFLERNTNSAAQPAFGPLAGEIIGEAGTTIYTDTTAAGVGPFFYRVGVKE